MGCVQFNGEGADRGVEGHELGGGHGGWGSDKSSAGPRCEVGRDGRCSRVSWPGPRCRMWMRCRWKCQAGQIDVVHCHCERSCTESERGTQFDSVASRGDRRHSHPCRCPLSRSTATATHRSSVATFPFSSTRRCCFLSLHTTHPSPNARRPHIASWDGTASWGASRASTPLAR
jgi:hypothetical protein